MQFACLDRLEPVVAKRGTDHVQIAPSCSLLHVPIDLDLETGLDADVKSWLAFVVQKMGELATLGRALAGGRDAVRDVLAASAKVAASRAASTKVHDAAVAKRMAAVTPSMAERKSAFAARAKLQRDRFKLPPFPTTTIGSFRRRWRFARRAAAKGTMSNADYDTFLREERRARFAGRRILD